MEALGPKDLRATWGQSLKAILTPVFLFLVFRWLFFEPFVIPSGSMLPNLQIHDHIFVNKLAYGIHFPFSKRWLVHWKNPEPGEIVVFRHPPRPEVFFVKRVVAGPGDRVAVQQGTLFVNGVAIPSMPTAPSLFDSDRDQFRYFLERGRLIRYESKEVSEFAEVQVPADHFFVMGDNRDFSSDSRVWGTVPMDHLVGRAALIWLACENTLASAEFLCDPQAIRWNRLLLRPQ